MQFCKDREAIVFHNIYMHSMHSDVLYICLCHGQSNVIQYN